MSIESDGAPNITLTLTHITSALQADAARRQHQQVANNKKIYKINKSQNINNKKGVLHI